jgi:hypothetical protein
MTPYVVNFFKTMYNDIGHPKKVFQSRVVIRHARSLERALEAAKKRLSRGRQLSSREVRAWDAEIRRVGEGERLG